MKCTFENFDEEKYKMCKECYRFFTDNTSLKDHDCMPNYNKFRKK